MGTPKNLNNDIYMVLAPRFYYKPLNLRERSRK